MVIMSEREDGDFKQMILLMVNLIWFALEYLFLDWETQTKFRVIRLIYFMFANIMRIDIFDHPDTDDYFWPKFWKTCKVWVTDVVSMMFCVWAFGRSAYL